jgi:hypothetical protein
MLIKRPRSAVLCSQCTDLFPLLVDISAAGKSSVAYTEWWNATFGKVKLSIQGLLPNKCELCRILHNAFLRLPGFESENTVVRISNHSLGTYKNLVYDTCVFRACGVRLALAPIVPVVTTDDGELISVFAGRPVLQSFNPMLAKLWMANCHQQHVACTPDYSSKDFDFSFRLIDVQEGRLVDAPSDARYVALSYVWGGVKQVMLKKSNKKFLEQAGSITPKGLTEAKGEFAYVKETVEAEERVIPRTIREAIQLCQLMNERYLWTDSLCILQDDDIQMGNGAWTNSDKMAQIPKMDIIYGASALTVIAACGADSNAGLPGVHATETRKSQTVGKIGDQVFLSVQDDPMEAFWSTIWESRAWTFQEFLLSKRHLIFLPEQVVFHCSTTSWCEDHPYDDPIAFGCSVPGWTRSWQLRPFQMPVRPMWADNIFFPAIFIDQYYSVWLSKFLKRRLTVPSDILIAFDGALSASKRHLGTFHQGLPVDFFCECLHWSVGKASMSYADKSPYQGLTQRRSGFPSWSWTGWMWNVAPSEEFAMKYAGKVPEHYNRVGIWGTRVSARGNVELWSICAPDVKRWDCLNVFPGAALEADEHWMNNDLPNHLETVKKSAQPTNCLVIKTVTSYIFVSSQTQNNILPVFPSSDFTSEKPLGGISLSSEWREKIEAGLRLQIIIIGSFFTGPDTKFPDQTDENDPHTKCLIVQQVGDGTFERLNTFVVRTSMMKRLDWTPIVAVLQ